ncbi:hypothetical protein IQ06DRAFT_130736 [Phaeosphaeriaceae sp. SRC1lsM3a]|nr:hypothetical protein IQ06DRAFT_130736 [Stagonospora sp. SRC1lsM3a]
MVRVLHLRGWPLWRGKANMLFLCTSRYRWSEPRRPTLYPVRLRDINANFIMCAATLLGLVFQKHVVLCLIGSLRESIKGRRSSFVAEHIST